MIQHLPEEIIAEIFSFLHSKFIILINSLVCKKWHSTIRLVHLRLKLTSHQEFSKFSQLLLLGGADQLADSTYYLLSIKKLSAFGCNIKDEDIVKLCSSMNGNALEYLSLRGNEFSSNGLKLIIDKFPKLKSLDIRGYKSDFQYLLESRERLPELVKLKVDYLITACVEDTTLSIKPQIKHLALHSDRFARISILPKLDFENVESLVLEGNITTDISNLPLKLKKLSLSYCFTAMRGIEKISENLESLSLHDVQITEFELFEKCEFKNLKSLAFNNMGKNFWEMIYSSDIIKPLNLTRLSVNGSSNSKGLLSKIANLESLTSLDIASIYMDLRVFVELMGECKWKNLTELDISLNPLTDGIVPILESLPSLKILNARLNLIKNAERGLLLSLGSRRNIKVECRPTIESREDIVKEELCSVFLNSLPVPSTNNSNNATMSVSSFEIDKNLKILIKGVHEVTNAHTEFKPFHTLSYIIEGKICNSYTNDRKYTKCIPHSDCLEWNEEIIFDSVNISDLSCDAYIELTLFCLILNPITGITSRKYISKIECSVFDSNLELRQGNVKLFTKEILPDLIETKFSMDVSFEKYEYSVKYEIEKEPPKKFKEYLEDYEWNQQDVNITNPDKLIPFLRSLALQNPWAIYLAKQYVTKWEKPQHFMKIFTILAEDISMNSVFIKLVITEMLNDIDDDQVVRLLPYLTTCIKFDSINGVLTQYLLKRAMSSKVIGNQFFWLLKVESHKHPICKIVLSHYMSMISMDEREIIQNQCLFFDSLEQVKKDLQQDFTRPLFIPFHSMTDQVVSIIPSYQKLSTSVKLQFSSGEILQLAFSLLDHLYGFIIESFVDNNRYWMNTSHTRRNRTFPIAFGKGFSLSPINIQVGSKLTKLSDLTASQSQSFKDTLLQTAAFDAFIGHIFDSSNPSTVYLDTEGHLERNHFYPKSFERILGLVILAERMIYNVLNEYIRKENLFEPFKQFIDGLSNNFLENIDLIISYFKPFGYKQRNFIRNLENRLKDLETYKYQ